MNYIIYGHSHDVAVRDMTQVFYPNENSKLIDSQIDNEWSLKSIYQNNTVIAQLYNGQVLIDEEKGSCTTEDDIKRLIKLTIHELLVRVTGKKIAWGILTGIRPAKIASELFNNGLTDKEVFDTMKKCYLTDNDKIDLSIKVSKAERRILENNDGSDYSIYVGIPFCPTRCLYCSFTSYPVARYATKMPAYMEALKKEIQYVKKFSEGRRLESIYIGGGTPTSIDDHYFEEILCELAKHFNISSLKEFTVEAGRPDTISPAKLTIMKKYGVTRISVNPQTMNDKTLKLIGRAHSADEFLKAFHLARDKGFDNINVDLILGLFGETIDDVAYSLDEISKLSPEAVTLHTLAVKRASRLKEEITDFDFTTQAQMEDFLVLSGKYMDNLGLKPYYMYRQKNMVGNYENVGYAKPGYEGIYNVQIMEEKQIIIAIGAGSASKFVYLNENRIERAYNVKDVDEYIARIDEMIQRKTALANML